MPWFQHSATNWSGAGSYKSGFQHSECSGLKDASYLSSPGGVRERGRDCAVAIFRGGPGEGAVY